MPKSSPCLTKETAPMSYFEKILTSYCNDVGLRFMSGTLVGVLLAGLFNPIDRAIYLAQTNGRRLLLAINFTKPFEGFGAAMFQRTVSGSSYFVLQSLVERSIVPLFRAPEQKPTINEKLGVGFSVGLLNALLLNPLSVIKSHMWSESERISKLKTGLPEVEDKRFKKQQTTKNVGFFKSSKAIGASGGAFAFYRGIWPMVPREIFFGAFYEATRYGVGSTLPEATTPQSKFLLSLVADTLGGAVGSSAASIPNFIRNKQLNTPLNEKPPTAIECLIELNRTVMQADRKFLKLRQTLCWGAGTGRVALAMGLGQGFFKFTYEELKNKKEAAENKLSSRPCILK